MTLEAKLLQPYAIFEGGPRNSYFSVSAIDELPLRHTRSDRNPESRAKLH